MGGHVLVTGRIVDVRAPRLDAARIPPASPAPAMEPPGPAVPGSSRRRPADEPPSVIDAAGVADLIGRVTA